MTTPENDTLAILRVDIHGFLSAFAHDYPEGIGMIYEYLQNAIDYDAHTVTVDINSEDMHIVYDGKVFDQSDAEAFTALYASNKLFRKGHTGGFGRGVYSALVYMDTVIVRSAQYALRLNRALSFTKEEVADYVDHNDFRMVYRDPKSDDIHHLRHHVTWSRYWESQFAANAIAITHAFPFFKNVSHLLVRGSSGAHTFHITDGIDDRKIVSYKSPSTTTTITFWTKPIPIDDRYGSMTVIMPDDTTAYETSALGSFHNRLPSPESTGSALSIDCPFQFTQTRDRIPLTGDNDYAVANRKYIFAAAGALAEWIADDTMAWIDNGLLLKVFPRSWFSTRSTRNAEGMLRKHFRQQISHRHILQLNSGKMACPRDIKGKYVIPGVALTAHWPCVADITISVSNPCVEAILDLCLCPKPDSHDFLLAFLAAFTAMGTVTIELWGSVEQFCAWQGDVARLCRAVSPVKRGALLKRLSAATVILARGGTLVRPRAGILVKNGQLVPATAAPGGFIDEANNNSDFLKLFALTRFEVYLSQWIKGEASVQAVRALLSDDRVFTSILPDVARHLVRSWNGWKSLSNTFGSLQAMAPLACVPDSLRSLRCIKRATLHSDDLAMATALSALAGTALPNILPVSAVYCAISQARKQQNRTALKVLFAYLCDNWRVASLYKGALRRVLVTQWVPSTRTLRPQLSYPADLYAGAESIRDLLGDKVSYCDVHLNFRSPDTIIFINDLGMRSQADISVADVIAVLNATDAIEWRPQQLAYVLDHAPSTDKVWNQLNSFTYRKKRIRICDLSLQNAELAGLIEEDNVLERRTYDLCPRFWQTLGVTDPPSEERLVGLLQMLPTMTHVHASRATRLREYLATLYPHWERNYTDDALLNLGVECRDSLCRRMRDTVCAETHPRLEWFPFAWTDAIATSAYALLSVRQQQLCATASASTVITGPACDLELSGAASWQLPHQWTDVSRALEEYLNDSVPIGRPWRVIVHSGNIVRYLITSENVSTPERGTQPPSCLDIDLVLGVAIIILLDDPKGDTLTNVVMQQLQNSSLLSVSADATRRLLDALDRAHVPFPEHHSVDTRARGEPRSTLGTSSQGRRESESLISNRIPNDASDKGEIIARIPACLNIVMFLAFVFAGYGVHLAEPILSTVIGHQGIVAAYVALFVIGCYSLSRQLGNRELQPIERKASIGASAAVEVDKGLTPVASRRGLIGTLSALVIYALYLALAFSIIVLPNVGERYQWYAQVSSQFGPIALIILWFILAKALRTLARWRHEADMVFVFLEGTYLHPAASILLVVGCTGIIYLFKLVLEHSAAESSPIASVLHNHAHIIEVFITVVGFVIWIPLSWRRGIGHACIAFLLLFALMISNQYVNILVGGAYQHNDKRAVVHSNPENGSAVNGRVPNIDRGATGKATVQKAKLVEDGKLLTYRDFGTGFVIGFAVGALIVTLVAWAGRRL